MKWYYNVFVLIWLLFPMLAEGQEEEHPHKHVKVEFGGSVGLWADFYFTNADSGTIIKPKRPVGVYRFNFSPILKVADWSFSSRFFLLSNEPGFSDIDKDFFSSYRNNIGLTVKYKNQLEFQLGRVIPKTTAMVSGNVPLTGAGVKYNGKKIGTSFYYGHTGKAREENQLSNINARFKRNYYIGNIRFGNLQKSHLGFNVLLARDRNTSITMPDKITPKENVVSSINSTIKLTKSAYIKVEAGASLYTNNGYLNNDSLAAPQILKKLVGLNESTRLGYATSANIGTNAKHFSIDLGAKYYSQEYQTLGVFYQQNDYLDISGKLNIRLWKNKFIFNTTTGLRLKEFGQSKLSGGNNLQFIGNYNVSITPNQTFSLSAYYTNFNLSIEDGTERYMYNSDEFMIDTIQGYKIRMTSNSMGITPSVQLGKNKDHRVFASYNLNTFRNADVFTNEFSDENSTSNITLGYYHKKGNISFGMNTGYFLGRGVRDLDYFHVTPRFSAKLLKKKLLLNTSIKWARNAEKNSVDNQLFGRVGLAYNITEKITSNVEWIQNIYNYGIAQNDFKLNETRLRTSLKIRF